MKIASIVLLLVPASSGESYAVMFESLVREYCI